MALDLQRAEDGDTHDPTLAPSSGTVNSPDIRLIPDRQRSDSPMPHNGREVAERDHSRSPS